VTEGRSFIALTLDSLAENLALDELLVVNAETGESGEVLRIWEQRDFAVVLGAGCRIAEDVDIERCHADNIPILRRSSGGGTVLLGQGCLCYSLVLQLESEAALAGIRSSYAWILARIVAALSHLNPDVHQAGISDLAIGNRKFSGSAQQRKRSHLLHHGTLLYDFDLARVGHYLRLPERRPEYRKARTHDEFLINIPASSNRLVAMLLEAWQVMDSKPETDVKRVRVLAHDKYSTKEWTYRR
jgi:lipoate-protein ligase A